MRKALLIMCALGVCTGFATASDYIPGATETVSFTAINSVGPLGDPNNVTMSAAVTGGFVATSVAVTGTLTEIQTGTYASEADINIVAPGGSVAANGATTSGYTGTIAVGPTVTTIGTPFDPAGTVSFEFYESYDDGAGPDQIWDDVTIEFRAPGTVIDGSYSLGALPADGTIVSNTGTNVAGGFDYYDFEIGAGVGAPGDYLNVQTLDPNTGDTIDTELAIFDAAGILVGYDDDGQVTALGGLYSMLSFGADDPYANTDTAAGSDGLSLAAGAYTVVLGGYDSNFEDLTIGTSHISEVVPGTSDGDYEIRFSYVPEPTSLLGLLLLGLLRRR